MASLDAAEDINCVQCGSVLPKDSRACTASFVDGIFSVACGSCPQMNFCCFVCSKSFPQHNNIGRHAAGGPHQSMLCLRSVIDANAAVNSLGVGEADLNFLFDDSGEVKTGTFGGMPGDEAEPEHVVETGNWLTDLPGPLGPSALTLDAIRDGDSFPKHSKSPECCCFESQNPGQEAKCLTAKPFDLLPDKAADEEALFHMRMTKFLKGLTTEGHCVQNEVTSG